MTKDADHPRPGERVQTFWCDGCREWHRASVLGGAVHEPFDPFPVQSPELKSLREVRSEIEEMEFV